MSISENFGIHIFSGFSVVLIIVEKIHVRIILGHPILHIEKDTAQENQSET